LPLAVTSTAVTSPLVSKSTLKYFLAMGLSPL
jgi:hypothetical protein